MALVWQPQEAAYLQICNLLSEYQKPGANQALVRASRAAPAAAYRAAMVSTVCSSITPSRHTCTVGLFAALPGGLAANQAQQQGRN